MLRFFNDPWDSVPLVVVDVETTGLRPGYDYAVSFGAARFEHGRFVASFYSRVWCPIQIPIESRVIHGLQDDPSAPDWTEIFKRCDLLQGAQLAAFNAPYDKMFIPPQYVGTWPWLDILPVIQRVDKYVPGADRHKLTVSCARHGIVLPETDAHNALADARAAGELLYKVGRETFPQNYSLGRALDWCQRAACLNWFQFHTWKMRGIVFRASSRAWFIKHANP